MLRESLMVGFRGPNVVTGIEPRDEKGLNLGLTIYRANALPIVLSFGSLISFYSQFITFQQFVISTNASQAHMEII